MDHLLHESRTFPVPPSFAKSTLIDADGKAALLEAAEEPDFWESLARAELEWDTPFTQVLDESDAPVYRWFADGTLNASKNCLDRHLPERAEQTAIIWEAEDGSVREISYQQLTDDVAQFAGSLRSLGVERGDRVIIYMPLVPEVAVAMLACARIGAIHSVVFGGFSAKALADRIQDTGAKVVITADGGFRGGKTVPLKDNTDEALSSCDVDHVVVLRRTGQDIAWNDGDVWWHDLEGEPAEPVSMGSEDPLFILYTSGSTGKPKGILHTHGGYLTWARASTRWVFDLQDDIYWCTADVGWITGHTYLVYGPLMNGATILMYEGAPTYPKPDRFWELVAKHQVTILYTAPTAIRALMAAGDAWPNGHNLSSLRLLGSVGEPINPEAWMWYHTVIGGGRCPIVDTWWQTETGGIVLSPLPGADTLRPGSCTGPLPGMPVDIVDKDGKSADDGFLVLRKPWPSMLRGVWGDPQRYKQTYWSMFDGMYLAGDTARHDPDYWILGRFDDVLNVSGHRIGTMEVESSLVAHPAVAEAAVVGAPHPVTGECIWAFVVSDGHVNEQALRDHVAKDIGKTARPEHIVFAKGLPKTRSGKIMRRILRSIAKGEEITQDVSTLEDAAVVEAVKQAADATRSV